MSARGLHTPLSIFHTANSSIHIPLSTLYTPYSTLHTLLSIFHTLLFIFHTLLSIFHTLLYIFHTQHSSIHIPHSTLFYPYSTLHIRQSIFHTPHSSVHIPHSTFVSPYSTLHIRHSIFHTPQFTHSNTGGISDCDDLCEMKSTILDQLKTITESPLTLQLPVWWQSCRSTCFLFSDMWHGDMVTSHDGGNHKQLCKFIPLLACQSVVWRLLSSNQKFRSSLARRKIGVGLTNEEQ